MKPHWNYDGTRFSCHEANAALSSNYNSPDKAAVLEAVRLSYATPSVAWSEVLQLWVVRDCFHQLFTFEQFPAAEIQAECQEPGSIAESLGDDGVSTRRYYTRRSQIERNFDEAERARRELAERPKPQVTTPTLMSADEINNLLADLF